MARIRTIKPDFWADEKMANVCREARLLYIGLWNFSDDYGVCKGSPVWLKSQIFGYDDISKETIIGWLKELIYLGRISEFDNNGESFIFIHNFMKHQKIDNPSKFRNAHPPDFSQKIVEDSEKIVEDSEKNAVVREGRSNSKGKRNSKVRVRNTADADIPFDTILLDFNTKADRKCILTREVKAAIIDRWEEGRRLDDFLHVHTVKCQEWLHDHKMVIHLHPKCLYRQTNFDKYVNQPLRKVEQEWTPPND